ncbi:MAG: hypothetical protein M1833_001404 [Piccolia ochrophora]|nr:MAG: hypothetical protein M1833_001404 [Piccolia ochrophora]
MNAEKVWGKAPKRVKRVQVQATGIQTSADRYPTEHISPKVSKWRNNLVLQNNSRCYNALKLTVMHQTALSQTHNLYFEVQRVLIAVFEPQYPDQILTQEPVYDFIPLVSSPSRPGYIDVRNPHAINHIVVAELGDEEILVCACDDGDILAWRIRNIVDTIQSSKAPDGTRVPPTVELAPFFKDTVEQSAWGIAVHKQARMIAVSSNTHDITVFAPALVRSDNPADETEHQGGEAYTTHLKPNSMLARMQDHRITLSGHTDNIPNIAFYNSDDDPHGQYLVSVAIDGRMIIHRVWSGEIVADITLGGEAIPSNSDKRHFHEERRSWGVLCLDPRCFKSARGQEEVFGCIPDGSVHRWDVSRGSMKLSDTSSYHTGFAFGYTYSGHGNEMIAVGTDDLGSDTEVATDVDEWSNHELDEEDESEASGGEEHDEDDLALEGENLVPAVAAQFPNVNAAQLQAMLAANEQDHLQWAGQESSDFSQPDGAVEAQGGASSLRHFRVHNMPGKLESLPEEASVCSSALPQLPFALLHTSEKVIRLYPQPPMYHSTVCGYALSQHLPTGAQHLRLLERLNMLLQIPELGIAIVGCQTGRVAILALTRFARSQLFFRLDAILPFDSQELRGVRPYEPLLGIAAAPIQGRQKGSTSAGIGTRREKWKALERTRRYRLMLTYLDGTVLSYEIGKDDGKGRYNTGNGGNLAVV